MESSKILVGLHGMARSGKDSLGGMLFRSALQQGVNLPCYALAAPIKDMMCALLGWGDDHRDGELKEVETEFETDYGAFMLQWERYRMSELFDVEMDGQDFDEMLRILELDKCNVTSPRKVFQLFGTEYGREAIASDVWLDLADAELNKVENAGLIITDVRFDNEARWVRDREGLVIHVRRDGQAQPTVRGHVSEDGIDPELVNYQTPECRNLDELFIQSIHIEGMVAAAAGTQAMEHYRRLTNND